MKEHNTTADRGQVTFRLWGAVEASRDGKRVAMGSLREQGVLAGLLAAKGREVRRESLKSWAWDDEPDSASGELNHFMSNLRKRLDHLGFADALVNKNGLCRLKVPDDVVDAHRIKALSAREKRDDRHAAELLAEALRLAQGEPLAGLTTRRAAGYRKELEKERHALKIAYYRVEVRSGRYEDHLGAIGRLLDDDPADARVAALLMCALFFAGNAPKALGVYGRHWDHLVGELGVEVSPELDELRKLVSHNDLTPGNSSFALGKPYSADGEPRMNPTEPLVVAIRPDAGSLDEIRRAAVESFGSNSFEARRAGDCLVCVVATGVAPAEVVGVWMDRLVGGMPYRGQVGIGVGSEERVCELARSAFARAVLDRAPDSNLVVAVSDDVYDSVARLPELQIDAAAYRRDDRSDAGWVRVPGLSVPPRPKPADDPGEVTTNWPAPSGPNVAFYGETQIEKQMIATTVKNMKW